MHGYNAHNDVWVAAIGEELCEHKPSYRNMKDKYDVAMKMDSTVVGHLRQEGMFSACQELPLRVPLSRLT